MKKFLMGLFALAVATTVAMAGVGINWVTGYGAYAHDAPDTTGGTGALLDSYNAIWQLIYAGGDDTIDPPEADNAGTGYVTGDDEVWAQRIIAQGGGAAGDGTTWNNWMNYISGSSVYEDLTWNTAGFVYQRVFETATLGVVVDGDWYYDSELLAFTGTYSGGGQPAQDFYVDGASGASGFQPTQQVPEPATMGLLGLGALVMAIRRRRA